MSELPTYEGYLNQLTGTIIDILGAPLPNNIPPPLTQISDPFKQVGVDRIILVILDNFGLFETTYYKPQNMIANSNALVLLSTKNPYTLGMFHQLMFGGFQYMPDGFHLLKYLNDNQKSTVFVGRKKDVDRYSVQTPAIPKDSDMNTWIEAAKVINRYNLSIIHFLDFETLHRKSQNIQGSPEELIEKLINRTDKWIHTMFMQLRSKSMMIILGNHGRYKIDMNYSGKIAQWRAASVPLALCLYK
jgi:hypothetical protein